jgi:8-oxo-dGTP diphosphatase
MERCDLPVGEQGFRDDRFCVIPRSLIFLFNVKGEVLLLRGAADKKIWAGQYNGVGGHVEAGEDVLESAERELAEETGITGVALRLVGQVMVEVDAQRGIALFIFKGTYDGEALSGSEEGSLAWVDLADLDELPVVEDLRILLPKVAAHDPADPLIYGKYLYDDGGELITLFR